MGSRVSSRWLSLVAAMFLGFTATAASASVSPVGVDRAKATVRAPSIPAGVWSGPGAFDGVYDVLVVRDGPAGSQPVFFAESHSTTCDWGPAVMSGTVALKSGDLVLTGDLVCADTGEVGFSHAQLRFETGDDFPDAIDPVGFFYGSWERRCAGSGNTMTGTSGDDVLTGTSGNDVIDGRGGNDRLEGKGGMDILCGGDGNDKLIGGGDIDVLVGGAGKDKPNGGPGWDLLLGEGGNDKLKGGGGGDFMFGDAGDDKLNGGKGTDYADGGTGPDNCKAETRVDCANAYVVTSADGVVTLDVPDRHVEVSVRRLGEGDLPDDLADAPLAGSVYVLEPEGATFDQPVKVTMRIPVEDLDGDDAMAPLVIPFLFSGDGDYDGLDDVAIVISGGEVVITGTTTHFSNLAQGDRGVAEIAIAPPTVTTTVGGQWTALATTPRVDPGLSIPIDAWHWSSDGAVGQPFLPPDPENPSTGHFRCNREGKGHYQVRMEFVYRIDNSAAAFLNELLEFAPDKVFVHAQGEAKCTAVTGQINGVPFDHHGPVWVPPGGELRGAICVPGVTGVPWFATLGEPPGGPLASHYEGVLDDDGCLNFSIQSREPAGTMSSLYTSDGAHVERVVTIDVDEVLL